MPESIAGADASSDDASGDTTSAAPTDLGVYGTDDALGDAALAAEERGVDRSSAEPDAPDEDVGESAGSTATEDLAQLEALDGTAAACAMNTGSVVVASFSGTVGGEVRLAWVVRDETGGLGVVVVDPATCVVVATRP
jgi:hypothetical protein